MVAITSFGATQWLRLRHKHRELLREKFLFFQAEDGIRVTLVTGVQTCALPISARSDSGWGGFFNPPSFSPCQCRRRREAVTCFRCSYERERVDLTVRRTDDIPLAHARSCTQQDRKSVV